jgi:Tol biopolymer transport system component
LASNQTRLTTSSIGSYQPAWSPDGTQIAFRGYDSQANSDIYLINTDGTGLTNRHVRSSTPGKTDFALELTSS